MLADFRLEKPHALWQTIVGMDYSQGDEWSIGGQYQVDYSAYYKLHWLAVKASRKNIFSDKLTMECFIFKGLNNADSWLQPQIRYRLGKSWEWLLRADIVWGKVDKGYMGFLRHGDRILSWLTCQY